MANPDPNVPTPQGVTDSAIIRVVVVDASTGATSSNQK